MWSRSERQDLAFGSIAIEFVYVLGAGQDDCVLALCTLSKTLPRRDRGLARTVRKLANAGAIINAVRLQRDILRVDEDAPTDLKTASERRGRKCETRDES
jgi:hypothetical protein